MILASAYILYYIILFVCYMVATSDKWIKSKIEVSADVGMFPLNTRDWIQ